MSQMGLPRGKHEADQFAPVFTHLVQKALVSRSFVNQPVLSLITMFTY
jgi:hypothetical protein